MLARCLCSRVCVVCWLVAAFNVQVSTPQGHYENVALQKQCEQSSRWDTERSAGNAVNGNTNGDYETYNCIHTGSGDTSPWWRVNLGRRYPIYTIVVWARTNFVYRMSQVRILVDSQVCYSYGNLSLSTERQMTINCTTGVLYGSTVQLVKYNVPTTRGDNSINLCELEVLSCTADYWESGCDHACGACRGGAGCDKLTGYCDMGCAPGYKNTSLCVEVCANGTYGLACSGNCNNNCVDSNACDKVTGNCTCNPGWKPASLCEKACDKSFYGQDCLSMCGLGCSNKDCDKIVGTCACIPGYQPPFCQQVCPHGGYGQDCLRNCSENCLDVCDKVTGHCACQPGFLLPNCTQECPDGFFGQNCQQKCSENCADVCHKVTGHCTCKQGWEFPRCNNECDSGRYGLNCSSECGNCWNNAPCDRANGSCPQCQGNFQTPLCKVCKTGYYKKDCSATCSQNCDSVSCEQDNGLCTCKPGWNLSNCTRECSTGFYGQDCGETCGSCRNSTACRHDSGICETGCAEGFRGDVCKEAVAAQVPDSVGMIAGVAVGVIVALALAAVVVVIFIRRRRRPDKPVEEARERSKAPKPQAGANDNIYQNISTGDKNHAANGSGSSTEAQRPKPTAVVKPKPKPKLKPKLQSSPTSSPTSSRTPSPSPSLSPNQKSPPQKGHIYANMHADQGGQLDAVPKPPLPPPTLNESADDLELTIDSDDVTLARKKSIVYYSDDAYMTSEGATLKLDSVQQGLLDKLRTEGLLEDEFEKLEPGLQKPSRAGEADENSYKNRFKSILPYDENRVVLRGEMEPGCNDYINANYIWGHDSQKAYIAAQGAKKNTLGDFWKMVWQEKVTHIVMLTNVQEGEKKKCEQYWPSKAVTKKCGFYDVTGLSVDERADYVIRQFNVKNKEGSTRYVTQYHYVNWLDHSVPTATALVDFWRTVVTSHRSKRSPSPLLVHCSAGVGRTGTFIALDLALDAMKADQSEIDVFEIVQRMREDRCNMIQTKSQYVFLHEAILEAYTSRDTRLDPEHFSRRFPDNIDPNKPHKHIDREFDMLKQMRVLLHIPSYNEAEKKENIKKNRNPSVLPDDYHLVYLTSHVRGRNQFINAVYMPTFTARQGCIVTQLPLPTTLIDMWRLVDGNDVIMIVSLGSEVDGSEQSGRYWPKEDGEEITLGTFVVTLNSQSDDGHHLTSYNLTMKTQDESRSREVRLLHYRDWTGDFPGSAADLLHLVDTIDREENSQPPLVVQCIDGAARSGLFCALCDVIRRLASDRDVDVYMAVRHVQTARPKSITSQAQYRYIYSMVQEFKKSFEVYQNA